ncbi:reverse transcriptase domain-containing protein [Tanacetum coccineum]
MICVGCVKNGSGASLILIAPDDVEYSYALCLNFSNSNNDAEYEALLAGLWIAKEIPVKDIHAFVDSKLVASQIWLSMETSGKKLTFGKLDLLDPNKKLWEPGNAKLSNSTVFQMLHGRTGHAFGIWTQACSKTYDGNRSSSLNFLDSVEYSRVLCGGTWTHNLFFVRAILVILNRAYRLLHPENSARINGNNSRHISMRMHLSHNGPVRRINETVSLCATDTNAQVVPPGTICVHSNELLKMTPSDRKEKVTHPMLCGAVSILELSKVDIPKNFAQKMVVIEAGVGFMPCKMNFTNLIRLEVWELVPSLNAMLWSIALKGIYKVKALQLKELSSTRWMSKNAFLNGDLLRRSLFSQSPEASLLTNAKYALFEILRNMEWILALTPVDTPMVDRLETGTRISWVFPVDQNSIQRNGWLRLCTLQPVDDLVFAVWHVCMLQDAVSCRDVLRIYKKIVRRGGLSVFFSGDKIAREIEWLLNLLTSFGKMEREFIAECLPDISHQLALPRESVSNFLSSSHSMKSLTPETLRRLQEGEVQQLESNVLGG